MSASSAIPSNPRDRVHLTEVLAQLPGMAWDLPILARGIISGIKSNPKGRWSIGALFAERAAKHADRVFLRFEGTDITYAQANATANRYAATLASHGVGRGDVVGIMLRNSPQTVLLMLATVKLGAIAGMLNYNQRGHVLAHSIGLLDSKLLISEADFVEPINESGANVISLLTGDELDRASVLAPTTNPAATDAVMTKDRAFYIFTSGTTGLPKASVMTHYRWLRGMSGVGDMALRLRPSDVLYSCLPLYHNNALTLAVSTTINAGATLAIGKSFSVSRFWDEVIASRATAFIYIGELCRYLLNQPPKPTDRQHKVRVIIGNGLRPELWGEFTHRFGIKRVCEFYSASESNTAFVNALNIDRTVGICPMPIAYVKYDIETGEPLRNSKGHLTKVGAGEAGLLISKVTSLAPFDGYTDPTASEKKLVRDAFKKGDTWFNTGDLMRNLGWGHAAFGDRLGDTFRWKGENVATTEVEGALHHADAIEEATVFGVEVPGTDGRAGMAAIKLHDGAEFDPKALSDIVYQYLPAYALPLFVRIVDTLEHTTTFKSRKVELREQAYGEAVTDPLYVLAGRAEGYVPFYPDYAGEVAGGQRPKA
ncbi:long-chain-acyl-CoA synthetase [Mycolicibacterium phlei]|uniref:long-chain-acyl-CoA synthetase FadD6 n=1 Tax=Mycobacteroides chelonae TaxID=1774 RepID=UPI000618BB68|nr:long-chain-acyl-CoA synthetase FadD6 [Mycobacteroides chelonae]AKC38245.1 long-chain-acyl-CoA synthetase [Mycobacteroides chelonae]ANA97476.1 long-chain-acyl-CoA synthetase [Mycobacteroides chelonae CCUG 47445]VEG15477.1 long-chain-acyl-CoA synthetase [Mycolicibacterium phlei]